MNRSLGCRLFGLALVSVWAFALLAIGQNREKAGEARPAGAELGKPAPEFALKDLDGKEHKLSDLAGKIVVLEWTNHKCPYVVHHQTKAKTMQKTADRYKDKGVAWLAINSASTCEKEKEDIRKFATDNGVNVPILLDADGKVGKAYKAKTTPHMFVIDKAGVLVYDGAIDDNPDPLTAKESQPEPKNYVAMAIDALLAGKEVKPNKTKPYGCGVKYAE